jgi:hypothetical protein
MSFDWKFYVNIYPDLQRANINTYSKAITHWNVYGRKEGRICNPQMIDKSCKDIGTGEITIDDACIVKTRKFNMPDKIQCAEIDNLDSYNNFILIIDFPNGGGGATHFLNCIVSKFKKNTTFLIARNFDGLVYFYINDTLCLKNYYDLPDSIKFLDEIKPKIIKIFVNHTIGHNVDFLNKLFELEKHVTSITHDYSLITKNYQPYYEDIDKCERASIDIDKYDMIITQNIVTAELYTKYINVNKTIICELPDYYKSNTLIKTNNYPIVIAFIGAISNIKGSVIVNNIYNFYKHNKWVKCIIFGLMDIKTDIPNIKYNNIQELNNLLLTYKPNIIIETSISPETYSYTLTLSMLTGLPILYLKKTFPSVIQNRLSNYKKAYPFTDISGINKLLFKVSQKYFYTITPIIKFDPFWEKYFIHTKNNNTNIVIITSKIYVSNNEFSYNNNRSIYTPIERYNQVLETIKTVKQNIKNTYIILFDNSVFNQEEYDKLQNSVDKFINIHDDKTLHYYTDICKFKAFAEIAQMIKIYDEYLNTYDFNNVKNIFKISGRYTINNNFDYNLYNNDYNIFAKNNNVIDRQYYYTCFYKLNINTYKELILNLKKCLENQQLYSGIDLEVIIPKLLNYNFKTLPTLGITQNISVWKDTSNI